MITFFFPSLILFMYNCKVEECAVAPLTEEAVERPLLNLLQHFFFKLRYKKKIRRTHSQNKSSIWVISYLK